MATLIERLAAPLEFVFILILPLVVVAGGLVTLFAVGALFDALDNPQEWGQRIEGLFRGRSKPSKMAGPEHYYKPYWSR
jgi:hypothetical protein